MHLRVKRLALFISFSTVCLSSPYSVMAADSTTAGNSEQATERARPSRDRTAPIITLIGNRTITVPLNTEFQDPGATARDNVDGTVAVAVDGAVDTSRPATYILNYRAVDSSGNRASATRRVIVADTIAPVITLEGSSSMSLIQGGPFTDPGASATDNIDGEVPLRVHGRVRRNIPDTYTLTYIARDSARNEARATRSVTVLADTLPPDITISGDNPTTITQGTTFTDPGATTTDNSNGTVRLSSSGSINSDQLGTYTINYRARDPAGNVSTATRTVQVIAATPIDTTAPIISLNGTDPFELSVGDTYNEASATATDDVDGVVNVTITGTVDTTTAGTYTITYTATDAAGNTATRTRTVIVKPLPNVAPIANAGAAQTVAEQTEVSLDGRASADSDGSIVSYVWEQTAGTSVTLIDADKAQASFTAPNIAANETLSFKLTVTDDDGAFNASSTEVLVEASLDTTAPVISLNGSASLELTVGTAYTEAGATATDEVDGTVNVTITGTVDTATIGSYSVIYTATDAAGNTATLTRTVIVKPLPNVAPTANAGAAQTVSEQTTVSLDGSASTDSDGSIVSYAWEQTAGTSVTLTDADKAQASFTAPNIAANETLSFKLTVTDDDGAIADNTVAVNVKLIDTTKPVITLNGAASISLNIGANYTELGATALDDVDGNLNVTITGSVNTSIASNYTLTYTATDAAGNTATLTRTVNVIAAPQVSLGLNDTGVTVCGDATTNDKLCPIDGYPNQDAQAGRDFTHNDPNDGKAGFSFTKLDASGQPLADQTVDYATTPWSCVKDNVTGLTWEVKTDNGGMHDKDWTYRWYDSRYPDPTLPPNTPPNQGLCDSSWACLTGALANRSNTSNFCGYNDWRLPTSAELFGLTALDQSQSIDLAYFPNTSAGARYWTIETRAEDISSAWYLSNNLTWYDKKSKVFPVRLVRGSSNSN